VRSQDQEHCASIRALDCRRSVGGRVSRITRRRTHGCHHWAAQKAVTTFSTASRARLRHAKRRASARAGIESRRRECRTVNARGAAGMTTRPTALAGNGRGESAPVASAWRALSRAGALPRTRRRRREAVPASRGRSWPAVTQRSAPGQPISADDPSNGADDSFAVQRSQSRALPSVASVAGVTADP
jgi:hypothetical protein